MRAFLVAVLLAGCASAPVMDEAQDVGALGVASHAVGAEPGPFQHGPALVGFDHVVSLAGACKGMCQPSVVVPEAQDAWLDVRIAWDGTRQPGFGVEVRDPSGEPAGASRRGFDVVRAVAWAPVPGEHRIVVTGDGDVTGTVRLRSPDVLAVPGPDRLPNLVTLTPIEIALDDCQLQESVEEGAVRCLRLGNAVGNVGDGPLEVHLDHANAALSGAGLGQFVQRIYGEKGHRDVPASGAEFHFTHGHFHYAGLAHFELYPVVDGVRGDMAAIGHKRGFCFLDWGDMDSPEAPSSGAQHAEQNCLIPMLDSGWSMGISRGYYDYYWPALGDQYIDIEGVADGVYELVSIADGAGTLAESDETDNKASVVLLLAGSQVTVLEERALYDNPE